MLSSKSLELRESYTVDNEYFIKYYKKEDKWPFKHIDQVYEFLSIKNGKNTLFEVDVGNNENRIYKNKEFLQNKELIEQFKEELPEYVSKLME